QGRGHNRKDVSSSSTQPHPHRSNAHNQQPHHQYGNGTVNNFPKHQQYHPQSGYATVTASDVKRISVDSPEPRKNYRVVKNPHKQGAGPGGKVCNLKVQQVSTLANNPTLRNLEDGFNLEGIPPNWFCYSKVWNARNYAHELSSNFSSSKLCHEEDEGVGTVDFISDWKNIKTLLKSHLTDGHLSYFLQRVGNSVTLDHLDLLKIILFPDFRSNFPPEFIEFITKVIEKHG
ncbi:Erythroid differentiation-related factor 1, partial [Orchesella cincta]